MLRKLMLLLGIMCIITLAGAIIILLDKPDAKHRIISEDSKLQVVTTFYPVYLIGLNLADQVEGIEVKSLTKLNTGCLHDYQLTTQDMKIISEADVMVMNGGGMEGFLEDVKRNYPNFTIIDASQGITMLNNNPHVWLDPELYIRQIENVRDGLVNYINADEDAGPGRDKDATVQKIEQNAETYISKVTELDAELKTGSSVTAVSQPGDEQKAVIFHDSFAYLAKRAGIPVAFTVPLDSDTSLSADDIAAIIDEVRLGNIKYLFTEQQYSDSIAKQIEAETGAKEVIIDSVVTGNGDKASYLNAMYNNLEVLKKVLQ